MSISMDADDECSRVPIGVQVGRFDSSSKCECNAFLNQDLAVQRHGPRLVFNMFSNRRQLLSHRDGNWILINSLHICFPMIPGVEWKGWLGGMRGVSQIRPSSIELASVEVWLNHLSFVIHSQLQSITL